MMVIKAISAHVVLCLDKFGVQNIVAVTFIVSQKKFKMVKINALVNFSLISYLVKAYANI